MDKSFWQRNDYRKFKIDEETHCGECSHHEVCARDMEKRCVNYLFGTSAEKDCLSCTNHYARFGSDNIPCFKCDDFIKHEVEE